MAGANTLPELVGSRIIVTPRHLAVPVELHHTRWMFKPIRGLAIDPWKEYDTGDAPLSMDCSIRSGAIIWLMHWKARCSSF